MDITQICDDVLRFCLGSLDVAQLLDAIQQPTAAVASDPRNGLFLPLQDQTVLPTRPRNLVMPLQEPSQPG
eukprot:1040783-Amphidinium_carterae.1